MQKISYKRAELPLVYAIKYDKNLISRYIY